MDDSHVAHILQTANDAVTGIDRFDGVPPEYLPAMMMLMEAMGFGDAKHGREVWELLDSATAILKPALDAGKQSKEKYLQDQVHGFESTVARMREESQASRAKERMQHSEKVGGHVVENVDQIPGQREVLTYKLPALQETAQKMLENGVDIQSLGDGNAVSNLQLGLRTFQLVGTALTLPDSELMQKIENGEFANLGDEISSITDLTNRVMKTAQGVALLGLKAGGKAAARLGKMAIAEDCFKLSETLEKTLTPLFDAIDVVHNLIDLFNPASSAGSRTDAAVGLTSTAIKKGSEWAGEHAGEESDAARAATASGDSELGESIAGDVADGSKIAGGALASSLLINYEMLKILGASYMNTRAEIASSILNAYPRLVDDANNVTDEMDKITVAKTLADKESDPQQKQLLEEKQKGHIEALGYAIDNVITDGTVPDKSSDKETYAGSHPVLKQVFDPLKPLLGRKRPEEDLMAAQKVLWAIRYCIDHAEFFQEELTERAPDDPILDDD